MTLPALRPYQAKTVAYLRDKERAGQFRICVQSPTGSGKTRMISELLLDDRPQLLLTHRRVLLDQLSGVLTSYGIGHGIRANGYRPNHAAPIQLALYQSEYSRVFKQKRWPMHNAARVHVDEIHSFGGATVRKLLNAYQDAGASVIGWTATPEEISDLVDDLYVSATVPELIDGGYLVRPVIFGPDMPDVEKVETVARQANGDYSPKGLSKVWDVKAVFGSVVQHYHKLNPGHLPTILYAPGVPQSLWFAQQFYKSGIKAAHIDGDDVWLNGEFYKSDTAARQAVLDGLKTGDVAIVCNRYVLREGVDCPELACAILATAFGPRSAFVQSVGRVLRPAPGKSQGIIIDHGGNWLRHPPIDSAEPWDMTLSARVAAQMRIEAMRGPAAPGEQKPREPICCPQCTAIRLRGDQCPNCGHRHTKSGRYVLQVNGELRLQTGPAYKPRTIKKYPNAAEIWKRIYFGNLKNKPDRTPQQAWTYHAYCNGWNYLPKDLPLMPKTARGWFVPFRELKQDELIGDNRFASLPKFKAWGEAA